jgi:uncharacterized protein
MDLMTVLAGFGVGLMVGLTGVGGASLMTPILVLLFGIAPTSAVGSDLWFAGITKIAGGAVLQKKGSVDWEVARRLWLGSMPATLATLLWMNHVGISQLKPKLILTTLGIVLFATALAMLFKSRTHAFAQALRSTSPEKFKRAQPALTVLSGALLGFLVTLTSVGAGALGTAMLLYLYPLRMKPARLVGTDVVHAVPLTLLAGTGHMILGDVNFMLVGNLLIGSIPGIVLGSIAGGKVPERALRISIAVVLMAVSAKLLLI